jgi:hypothetical protein
VIVVAALLVPTCLLFAVPLCGVAVIVWLRAVL